MCSRIEYQSSILKVTSLKSIKNFSVYGWQKQGCYSVNLITVFLLFSPPFVFKRHCHLSLTAHDSPCMHARLELHIYTLLSKIYLMAFKCYSIGIYLMLPKTLPRRKSSLMLAWLGFWCSLTTIAAQNTQHKRHCTFCEAIISSLLWRLKRLVKNNCRQINVRWWWWCFTAEYIYFYPFHKCVRDIFLARVRGHHFILFTTKLAFVWLKKSCLLLPHDFFPLSSSDEGCEQTPYTT